MAKNKIQRIDQEIAKVREKIAEYQDKLKTLEAQKTEAENLEIVQMVRALRLTPEQLNAMLSGGTVPGMAAASANYNEQEDTDHEEYLSACDLSQSICHFAKCFCSCCGARFYQRNALHKGGYIAKSGNSKRKKAFS